MALGLAALLPGRASDAPTSRGEVKGQDFSANDLRQSEGNRTAKNAMLANQRSLLLLADKLYRRNPAEWRKNAATREAALAEVEKAMAADTPWPPLAGKRDVAALTLALSPDFAGARVAASSWRATTPSSPRTAAGATSTTSTASTRSTSTTPRATWKPRCGF